MSSQATSMSRCVAHPLVPPLATLPTRHPLLMLLATLLPLAAGLPALPALEEGPVALLLPDPDTHTKLLLQEDALALLRQLPDPLSIISVVGAYRTGKSWLLNELMGVSCSEGFAVGHLRTTQTKGVWILPRRGPDNGTVVYMDTEGFEGTGQAGVYDDRIFAFAALTSSVLVYNLAETIKQADIERLAFAAQLSQEFWRRTQRSAATAAAAAAAEFGDGADGDGAPAGAWSPPSLLWLVQRDFLQGGSVEEYLHDALKRSENPTVDEHATRLDKVRSALTCFRSMKAMGLVQPHVRRTELCDLDRSTFDEGYLSGAREVNAFVSEHALPRLRALDYRAGRGGGRGRGGAFVGGRALAALTSRLVAALNAHAIPEAASVVDSFNAAIVARAVDDLKASLRRVTLPIDGAELESRYGQLLAAAQATVDEESFGSTDHSLLEGSGKDALTAVNDANFRASQLLCDDLWARCRASLKAVMGSWLPSTSRYADKVSSCNHTMARCVGPASGRFQQRLTASAAEGTKEYRGAYRAKLHRALVVACLVGVVVSRFVLKSSLLELLCALAFGVAELLPSIVPFGDTLLWESERGVKLTKAYERAVYNDFWDLDQVLPLLVFAAVFRFACRRLEAGEGGWRRARPPPRAKAWPGRAGAGSADELDIVVSKAQ